jgi:hypothetical protein
VNLKVTVINILRTVFEKVDNMPEKVQNENKGRYFKNQVNDKNNRKEKWF